MNWKTLALCSVMAGATVVGCNSPAPGGDGSTGGSSTTYIVGAIVTQVPNDMTGTLAYGFDLDPGAMPPPAGSACGSNDWTDPYDSTSTHVDNQLVNALGVLGSQLGPDGADGAIRDQIETGKILLMLQVSGIDSYADDPNVMVHAVLGVVNTAACTAHTDMTSCGADTANHCSWAATSMTAGTCNGAPAPSTACPAHTDQASCMADMNNACNWSGMMMACSGIAANQAFSTSMDLGNVMGSITHGHLSAITDTLPLMFAARGMTINLVLHSVHFGGRITATNITQGEFGAQVLVADVLNLATMFGVSGISLSTIESVVMPDLQPISATMTQCAAHTDMASCMNDLTGYCTFMNNTCMGSAAGSHCAAISAGMGFSAVTAMLH